MFCDRRHYYNQNNLETLLSLWKSGEHMHKILEIHIHMITMRSAAMPVHNAALMSQIKQLHKLLFNTLVCYLAGIFFFAILFSGCVRVLPLCCLTR